MDNLGALLARNHNLEALKVSQSRTSLALSELLGPGRRLPLARNLGSLPLLGELGRTGVETDIDLNSHEEKK